MVLTLILACSHCCVILLLKLRPVSIFAAIGVQILYGDASDCIVDDAPPADLLSYQLEDMGGAQLLRAPSVGPQCTLLVCS